MNRTTTYRRRFSDSILWFSALLMSGATTGCVTENGDCPDNKDSDDISVSLRIEGGLPSATRADFTEEEGTLAESYINIEDLYVLAFEIGEGKEVADGESVLKDIIWSPTESERLKESVISSNGTEVYLQTFLSSENYNTTTPFAIVTIANTKNWSTTGFTLNKGVTKLGDLQKILNYPDVDSWAPDNAVQYGIPLFGIHKASLGGYNDKFNNSSNPYDLGDIWMLRALAKIELRTSADSQLEIESAAISANGWNNNLQLIPLLNRMEGYNASGNTGQVVDAPNFSGDFKPTPSTTALNMKPTGGAFVAYLPEYQLVGTDGTEHNNIIQVKVKTINGNELLTTDYSIPVKPYDGSPANEAHWNYLLRNYVYSFQITGVHQNQTLTWTVCPRAEYTSDIPTFE